MKFGKLVAIADRNRIRNLFGTEPIPSNANAISRNAADYLIESGGETMAATLNHFRESIFREFRQIALQAKKREQILRNFGGFESAALWSQVNSDSSGHAGCEPEESNRMDARSRN